MKVFLAVAVAAMSCAWPTAMAAQSQVSRFNLGVQLTSTASSEFDRSDVGIGGRVAWHPSAVIGAEAELDRYPANFPDGVPFSRARTEGLFGVTVGPAFNRIRPFGRVSPGFVRFHEAPQPIACIAIYPPPLGCTLAAGRTLFAFLIGGGVELFPTRRTFVRVDAGDRLVKYPGPVFDSSRTVRDEAFFSHDFRVGVGGGVRF